MMKYVEETSYERKLLRRQGQDIEQYFKVARLAAETGAERDEEGYDAEGYNEEGYNRFGFDRYGYTAEGVWCAPYEQESYCAQQERLRIIEECEDYFRRK